ncbi:MAG: hypothetical protein ACI9T7_001126 [Oleiphilaceae bacterium]|jgi:hypothetical protein
MNKVFNVLLLAALYSGQSLASPLASESGWEFKINLSTAYISSQSQLSTDDDNAITEDLNNSGKTIVNVMVLPLARISYTLTSLKTQVYIGNSSDQVSNAQFQYELGLIQQFSDDSKLTLAYFPNLPLFNTTWEDPYLIGAERIKTDEDAQGMRLVLENIAGSQFTVKYAYAVSDVDKENSGQSLTSHLTASDLSLLQRDSKYHRAELEMNIFMGSNLILKPSLQYTNRSADGDAHSYDSYVAQLGLLYFQQRHTLITTINTGVNKYSENNPVFDQKQDADSFSVFSIYSFAQPFSWEAIDFTIIAGYNQVDSEIHFYDQDALFIATGFTYTY